MINPANTCQWQWWGCD